MRERLYRVEAIVLKRTDMGEADRLLTVLTAERGKLRILAKGARKPSARKTGHVELFNHASLLIATARELDLVSQADTLDAFMRVRDDLDRLSYAYYFAELVDRFTEEGEENRPLFDLTLRALHWLETAPRLSRTARYFELALLSRLGYRPQLFTCVNCSEPLLPEENFFSPEGGGMLNPKCRGSHSDAQAVSLNALKVMRYFQTHEYAEVEPLQLSPEIESEVEGLLYYNTTHLLERKLKSVEFLNTLRFDPRLSPELH